MKDVFHYTVRCLYPAIPCGRKNRNNIKPTNVIAFCQFDANKYTTTACNTPSSTPPNIHVPNLPTPPKLDDLLLKDHSDHKQIDPSHIISPVVSWYR